MLSRFLLKCIQTSEKTALICRSHGTKCHNRNPRNLELIGFASKRTGWEFQCPSVSYWHKCVLEKTPYHTTGIILHANKFVVITASTREPEIQKYLYSGVDVSAAENIGRVLAIRCHQSGILDAFFDTVETPLTSEKTKAFYEAMLEGGINMTEQPAFHASEPLGLNYDEMSDKEKREMYPSLVDYVRTTPDWDSLKYPYSLRPVSGKRKMRNNFQILSKVRQGMVWDPFYHRMVLPEHKAHWQHEYEQRMARRLDKPADDTKTVDSVETVVPKKWQF